MRKLLIVAVLLLSITSAEAAYVEIEWDPSPSHIAGYKVYYGTASGEYVHCIDVGMTTSYRLDGLLEGVTYYFAATAYNNSGLESNFSNEVNKNKFGVPLWKYAIILSLLFLLAEVLLIRFL